MAPLRHSRSAVLGVLTVLFAPAGGAHAQHITVDGRLSPAQTLSGPNYAIGANLGRQVGGNLFQSFGIFGLSTGETATFSGPASVTNVIGRVAGGSASSINGAVDSTIKGANVYLINPSGIVLGPKAQVNVSGSFHASTADYLKMSDGKRFQATHPDASTLTSAPPQAFGFLTATPKPITVNGSKLGPVSGTLGLVGGRITVTGAKLRALAGTVHIASVASTGEVPVDPRTGPASTVTRFGPVAITAGSTLDVSDPTNNRSGGSILIRAGTLSVSASEINADNYGSGNGGRIVLSGDDQVTVTSGSSVHALTGTGSGAPIDIKTASGGSVTIDASTLEVGSVGAGNGGGVAITTGTLALQNGAVILSAVANSGNGGAIAIYADRVALTGNAVIASLVDGAGAGSGGMIVINATGNITIDGSLAQSTGAGIRALTFGPGNGGSVAVTAQNVAILNGGQINAGSGNLTLPASSLGNTGLGPAGSVAINAQNVSLRGDAAITAYAAGDGNAGSATVNAVAGITIDGSLVSAGTGGPAHGGSVVMNAQNITLLNGGIIDAAASGSGAPGTVQLTAAGTLLLDGVGSATYISTDASKLAAPGFGGGGAMTINAQTITIRGDADISSISTNGGRGGDVTINASGNVTIDDSLAKSTGAYISAETIGSSLGGSVNVKAQNITLLNGADISAATYGSGGGGIVTISATGAVLLDGAGQNALGDATAIYADTYGAGDAGPVSVSAGSLTINNTASITSNALGSGRGGSIAVNVLGDLLISNSADLSATGITSVTKSTGSAGAITVRAAVINITNNGLIATSSLGAGASGNIVINGTGPITLDGLGEITSNTSSATTGNGGGITVNAGAVTLQHGAIITSVNLGSGTGGNVTMTTQGPLTLDAAEISAGTFGKGSSGNVIVAVNGPLTIDGTSNPSYETGIVAATSGEGNGGNVTVSAGSIQLLNLGEITSSVNPGASGGGGVVSVSASGSILIENTSNVLSTVGTGIAAQGDAGSTGNAGEVRVSAGSLSILGGGASISSEADGSGAAGAVTVVVSASIVLDGAGGTTGTTAITAGAGESSVGPAGAVTVNSGSLTILNGALITSATLGAGQGGSLVVRSKGTVLLDGAGTTVVASTEGQGAGGSVSVSASQITVQDGAQIASSAYASGNGGSVSVSATGDVTLIGSGPEIAATSGASGNAGSIALTGDSLLLRDGASISTEALTANGGDIALSVQYLMYLQQSSVTTTVDGAKGNGGNITIDPRYLVLKDSTIQANAFGGNGGNINITAGQFIATPDSIVEASSAKGISGDITINAPSDTVTASLANPNRRIAPPTVSSDCTGFSVRFGQSTVTRTGRGALPESGSGMQVMHYFVGRPVLEEPRVAANLVDPLIRLPATVAAFGTVACR